MEFSQICQVGRLSNRTIFYGVGITGQFGQTLRLKKDYHVLTHQNYGSFYSKIRYSGRLVIDYLKFSDKKITYEDL